jgi:putative transposase
MRFRLIDEERAHHRVSRLCDALGVTRAGYHAWRKRPPSARFPADVRLLEQIRAAHAASRGTYGVPRLHAELRAQGIQVSRQRIARLMRQAGLEGVSRRRGRRRVWCTAPSAVPRGLMWVHRPS